MELKKNYDPTNIEDNWYQKWMEKGYFHSEPDEREPFTIVIPPPNVTGVLHMGHMLNNTIQDVLIRTARMQGKNALWLPGTDHASIATESKVVAKLKEEGINKKDLSRDEFLQHAWDWTHKHGGIILEQLKKLGASCDWDRTRFTMDDIMSKSVIKTFIDLYNKGYIYRGVRMVNWDPDAQTAVSDEEVLYREEKSKLYYVRYQVVGEAEEYLTIATTRPETILGDTAVCVNPNDERFKHFKGKKVIVPMVNRVVPVIEDDYVDMEFGTGALKITPAHDINDYEIGIRHQLESIDIFNDDGTLSEAAGLFIGVDRFEARKLAAKQLESEKALVKVEDYDNKIGYSERTQSVIEPKLSMQWFVKMEELAKPALENVMNDTIKFHPAKFKNSYKHWMENVKDWCISRQLWWGHRIPAWYDNKNNIAVAETAEEALEIFRKSNPDISINDIRQDEDVLDTWFSSWLWPISTFDGINDPDNKDITYYYPTNDLVTAPDIIFFWVARMIIAGYHYRGTFPFKNVYFTGTVRDNLKRKMSKSLGNSPDPLDLIARYGADGVRIGMLLASPAGNDLLFEESLCEQGRNFNNKVWNSFRLIQSWEVSPEADQPRHSAEAIKWFQSKFQHDLELIYDHYSKFRINDILMTIYKLFWDDFSSWLLEIVKPPFGKPIDQKSFQQIIDIFENLLKILHPFTPFITEELYQNIRERKNDHIVVAPYPKVEHYEKDLLARFDHLKQVVSAIRDFRKANQIPNKNILDLQILESEKQFTELDSILVKLCNLNPIEYVNEKPVQASSIVVGSSEYFVPMDDSIDVSKQLEKLKSDLDYQQGFLSIVMKKLGNDKFVNNAPAKVVEIEKKKKDDAEAKIAVLEASIAQLEKQSK